MEAALYRVHEIFESVQFEGANYGSWSLFVRFFGCNLRCKNCDTPQKTAPLVMTLEQLKERVGISRAPLLILTGGEPTLQDLKPLVLSTKKLIAVETNGTRGAALKCLKEARANTWITFSPKQVKDWPKRYADAFACCDEIKVVYGVVDSALINYCEQTARARGIPLFVQPLEVGGKTNLLKVVEFITAHPLWRLSIQVHKLLGMR